jgi:hypothetical protein
MAEPQDFTQRGATNYRSKTNWVRQRRILISKTPLFAPKAGSWATINQDLYYKVKKILEDQGIVLDFFQAYVAYAEALDKSQRTLPYMVDRVREHQILRSRWEGRGLDPVVLDALDEMLIYNSTNP